jgi:NifU-like protein involved in Fe-S cluster formation
MSDLNAIYSARILELAANISRSMRLAAPQATATAHSKLCGSTITVDIVTEAGRVVDFGQTVKACLLGQATASIVGREIVGMTIAEIRRAGVEMRAMLKENGPAPGGRFADLAVLEPVRQHKARHASALLVFDALDKAFADAEARQRTSDVVPAA